MPAIEGPRRAVLVGDHAGEGAREPVDQVLEREGDGERLPRPAEVLRHRLQVESEGMPDAEGERQDDAAAQQHDDRRPPAGPRGGG